ncbi:MAG: hypothetical protein HYZ34_09235 [Ignavibacteriae bacterium]|nr:hypothetical protein [Ignavibacteriota bacterium]
MKKPRAFLIHWNKEELTVKVQLLRSFGFVVASEHENGARAEKNIPAKLPDVIVVYLSRLPSHGRAVAEYFAERKSTRHIPLVFVDGDPEKVAKVKLNIPSGVFTTEDKLPSVLSSLIN